VGEPLVVIADCVLDEMELYCIGLEFRGFRCVPITADDAARAAELVLDSEPDAVVTRLLPGLFGVSLTRLLRADPRTATIPIVAITSLPKADLHAEARAAGADDVLLLPQSPDQIAEVLRALLQRA
jgi:DNA-binding response OmpR family regulator